MHITNDKTKVAAVQHELYVPTRVSRSSKLTPAAALAFCPLFERDEALELAKSSSLSVSAERKAIFGRLDIYLNRLQAPVRCCCCYILLRCPAVLQLRVLVSNVGQVLADVPQLTRVACDPLHAAVVYLPAQLPSLQTGQDSSGACGLSDACRANPRRRGRPRAPTSCGR